MVKRDDHGRFLERPPGSGQKRLAKTDYDSVVKQAADHAGWIDTDAGRQRYQQALDRLYSDDPGQYARVVANLTPKGARAAAAVPSFDLSACVREVVRQGTLEADARRNEAVQLLVYVRQLLSQPGTTLEDIRAIVGQGDTG
jgi:hypothetical protein